MAGPRASRVLVGRALPRIIRVAVLSVLTLASNCPCEDASQPPTTERQLVIVSGDGQEGTAKLPLPAAFVVRFEERTVQGSSASAWMPVSGTTVNWSASSGTLSSSSSTTATNGTAQTTLTPGTSTLVPVTVTATTGSVPPYAVEFDVDVTPADIVKVRGDGQRGRQGTRLPDSLVVQVLSHQAPRIPMANEVLHWTGTNSGEVSPNPVTTDAQGMARVQWTLGSSGESAQAQAVMLDYFGFSGATFSASADYTRLELAVVSGNNQHAQPGQPLPDSVVVEYKATDEATGIVRPVASATIDWTPSTVGNPGAVNPGIAQPAHSVTDAQGRAWTRWTLAAAVGAQGLNIRTPAVDTVAHASTFFVAATATGDAPPAGTRILSVTPSTSMQIGLPAAALPIPIRVKYVQIDAQGSSQPVAGAALAWAVASGGGSVSQASAITDAQGNGTAIWTMGAVPGAATLRITTPPVGNSPVSVFADSALATAAFPHILRVVSGDNQTAAPGAALSADLVVEYVDVNPVTGAATPIPGVTVTWSITTGQGSLSPPTSTTNAQGRATSRWTLGPGTGTQSASAAVAAVAAAPGSIFQAPFLATASTGTSTGPPRIAYAVVGSPPNPALIDTLSYNSTGAPITVAHPAVGSFAVTFQNQASLATDRETVLVSSYGSGSPYCKLASWTTVSADLVANVLCFDMGGSVVDAGFSIMMANSLAFQGRYAFAYADQPLMASYMPPAGRSFNSQNQPIQILRRSAGDYTVQFSGIQRVTPGSPEALMVTAIGAGPDHCKLHEFLSGDTARVLCWDGTGLEDAPSIDAPFVVALLEKARAGQRFALAAVTASSMPGTRTLPADSAFSSSAGNPGVQVTRTITDGRSILLFPGLGRPNTASRENIQVVSIQDQDASQCKVVSWSTVGSDLSVVVQCYHEDASMDDLSFYLIVVQ